MNDIRTNAKVGVLNFEDALAPTTLYFSEWWNGEGMDVNFTNDRDKIISLHSDELEVLVVAAKIVGLIDFKSIKRRIKQVKKEAKKRKRQIKAIRAEILGKD